MQTRHAWSDGIRNKGMKGNRRAGNKANKASNQMLRTDDTTCTLYTAVVPWAWSGAGYIRWIFGYCSNRLDIFLPRESVTSGSAKSPRKLRLKSVDAVVARADVLSSGERVAGRLCFDFCEFLFGFFEFLFFFLLTRPTVLVGTIGTGLPLLFFRPACSTTGRVASPRFRIIGFRNGIGSFLAAGVLVPYNVRDQSCNVARPIYGNLFYYGTLVR